MSTPNESGTEETAVPEVSNESGKEEAAVVEVTPAMKAALDAKLAAMRQGFAERDVAVIRIEIRAPGALVARPATERLPKGDRGDSNDPLRFDSDPYDLDNRRGDADWDWINDLP